MKLLPLTEHAQKQRLGMVGFLTRKIEEPVDFVGKVMIERSVGKAYP